MKTTILQIAGALALMASATFVVLLALGFGERHLVRWFPAIIVAASLAILVPMLSAKHNDRGE